MNVLLFLIFIIFVSFSATLPIEFSTLYSHKQEILEGDSLDIAQPVSFTDLLNIRDMRYTTIYIRAFDTYRYTSFDKSMAQTIQDAYSNWFHVELYMTPNAYTLTSGADQVQRLYDGLKENDIPIDKLWINVTTTMAWLTNTTTNCALIDSALNKARQLGFKKIGIFTSANEWTKITGNWKDAGNDVLLWYWVNNGEGKSNESPRSFDDFVPFGNWTQADVKQYGIKETLSNSLVNRDIFVIQRNP